MIQTRTTTNSFLATDGIDSVGVGESLDELYYRLEGRKLRVLFLEQSGAPHAVLAPERAGCRRIEDAIRSRIRSISVRRDLDERILLDEVEEDLRFDRAIETRIHQLATPR